MERDDGSALAEEARRRAYEAGAASGKKVTMAAHSPKKRDEYIPMGPNNSRDPSGDDGCALAEEARQIRGGTKSGEKTGGDDGCALAEEARRQQMSQARRTVGGDEDRKSTRLNSSHQLISY